MDVKKLKLRDTDIPQTYQSEAIVSPNFLYVLIALGIFFVSTRILKAKSSHIFALIVSFYLITQMKEQSTQMAESFNDLADYKLDMLGSPNFFHYDVNFINLFFDIYRWRRLNPYNYDNAIVAINNLLRLENDLTKGVTRCVDTFEVANEQGRIALNLIQGFSHVLDAADNVSVKKLKKVLKRLHILVDRHVQNMVRVCNRQESNKKSYDVNSRFIQDSLGPKGFDALADPHFEVY